MGKEGYRLIVDDRDKKKKKVDSISNTTIRSLVVKRFCEGQQGVFTKLGVSRRMEIKDLGDWSRD